MLRHLNFLLPMLFAAAFYPAHAINKCVSNGNISYTGTPCPDGTTMTLAEPPAPSDVSGARQQAANQSSELNRIENEKQQEEARDAVRQRQLARNNAATRKKCDSLALKAKWAKEDTVAASRKAAEKAKLKARRAAEKHALECS